MAFNSAPNRRIRDVLAVPGDQEVHAMNGRQRDMQSVRGGVRRETSGSQQRRRETFGLFFFQQPRARARATAEFALPVNGVCFHSSLGWASR